MTWLQPASASISALMSPVKAPFGAAWQSCPPSAMLLPARACRHRRQQARRRANQQLAGRPPRRRSSPAAPEPRASAVPSSRNPFIFQLPATSFVRTAMLRPHGPASISGPTSHRHAGGSTGPDADQNRGQLPPCSKRSARKAGPLSSRRLFGLLILSFGVWGIGDIFRNHPTGYGGRYGRRPEHPCRGIADGHAPRARTAERAVRRGDRYASRQNSLGSSTRCSMR